MATSEAKEIKKQETLVRFNIISYKTRLRVFEDLQFKISEGLEKKIRENIHRIEAQIEGKMIRMILHCLYY